MDPIQSLLQALQSLGTGTPESASAIQRSNTADTALNTAGSLMGSAKAEPRAAQASAGPAISTLGDLVNLLNPIDWMGGMAGGGAAAHVPGTYRALGMARAAGDLNPAQFVTQLQAQPNYQRYLELIQNMVQKSLGGEFPVARGAAQTDPLIQALQGGASKLPVTAVTHAPNAAPAETFAQLASEATRKPAYVAQGMASPADVAGIVPTRGQNFGESELVLNPQGNLGNMGLTAKYIPASKGFPFPERRAIDPVQSLLEALAQAAQPPMR